MKTVFFKVLIFPKTIRGWTSLPEEIVTTTSIDYYKFK